jgi:flavorubredoxin
MREMDYSNAIPVTRDIHWIGYYDEEAQLHCNPYLLIDTQDVVLFDPGSIPHFPIVMRKVIDLVNPADITAIVISHQDPDVCGNLAVVEDVIGREDLQILSHSKTLLLIRHYGLNSQAYVVDEQDYSFRLKSGRELKFIPTPFLHAPGAISTWDSASGTLFSADLFGGVSKEWALFAGKDYLEPLCAFHRLYMPSHELLSAGLAVFEGLPMQRICPQHGSILEGAQIAEALETLSNLQCGINLLGEPA